MKPIQSLSVIGLGYIGLPTAAMFAAKGIPVIGVDINPRAVETINRGGIHIVEPELDRIVHASVTEGLLRATREPEPADAFLIAVPTPFKEEHEPDLSHVRSAAEAISKVLKKGDIVILESTSPVGTTERLARWLAEARPDLTFPLTGKGMPDVCIAYCPERVLPGHVVRELVENDRVIGGITPACSRRACEIYGVFVRGELIVTDARTAEMCKLTENASRDVSIAFANELSIICGRLGVNVWELIRLANRHPRVNILRPGAGVGGHCIAVDPWFIVHETPKEARLIRTAREVNDSKSMWVAENISAAVHRVASLQGTRQDLVTVAVLGLAFKPNIDDLRESPAIGIVRRLSSESQARLLLVEPHIDVLPKRLSAFELRSLDEALQEASVVAALVAHDAFAKITPMQLEGKVVVDVADVLPATETLNHFGLTPRMEVPVS